MRYKEIGTALYHIYLRNRIDKAHGYIQEKRAILGDVYYLVATDIASKLLTGFPNYYKKQCDVTSRSIMTLDIYTNVNCSNPNSRVEYYMGDHHIDSICTGDIRGNK